MGKGGIKGERKEGENARRKEGRREGRKKEGRDGCMKQGWKGGRKEGLREEEERKVVRSLLYLVLTVAKPYRTVKHHENV